MSFFKAQGIGRVGQTPQMNTLPDGNRHLSLGVAFNRWTPSGNVTEWHQIHAYGKQAINIAAYVKSGQSVYVECDLIKNKPFTDSKGQTVTGPKLVLKKITFLSKQDAMVEQLKQELRQKEAEIRMLKSQQFTTSPQNHDPEESPEDVEFDNNMEEYLYGDI